MNRFFRSALFPLVIIAALVWLALQTLGGHSQKTTTHTTSQFITDVQNSPTTIKDVVIDPNKRKFNVNLQAFGDVHDKCTRNHTRKRLRDLVADVQWHLRTNGSWQYELSEIYYEPAVTVTVQMLAMTEKMAA